MEIEKLKIDLDNTVGWDVSGGKSHNVWGQVAFPKQLISIANKAKTRSRKICELLKEHTFKMFPPSIWTAYDKIMYADEKPIKEEDLPKTISATFKSCFDDYTAIVENMAMKIAFALDLPTSYNYIVHFEPQNYPQIIENYPSMSTKNKLSKLGIVSIDVLQVAKGEMQTGEYEDVDENGNKVKIQSFDDVVGDQLIPFEDIVTKVVGHNKLSGEQNLIENWVEAADLFIQQEMPDLPREKINKITNEVHSRIARSFLLKEYCGDCDNTSYNATMVFNRAKGTLVYGPNHDFGDSFNKLLRSKIRKGHGMTMEQINALPEQVRNVMLARMDKEQNESIQDIARQYAVVETSKKNIEYILEHFPESAREFFESVDKCVQKDIFSKIVDGYTAMTLKGEPILSMEEAEMFKEYLICRSAWMSELYIDFLKDKNQEVNIPIFMDIEDYTL